jgi:tRNA pseudouridine38-40 synthase
MKIREKKWILYKAVIEYNGSHYEGWQKQKEKKTVEGSIEASLSRLFSHKQRIQGASRTDRGVHASGQVCTFIAPPSIKKIYLKKILNKSLPSDIQIHSLSKAKKNFHPRFSVKQKIYTYTILKKKSSPLQNNIGYYPGEKIDIAFFEKEIKKCIGTHDFRLLSTPEQGQPTVRTIDKITLSETKQQVIITFKAKGFLRYMIRKIIGTAFYASKKNNTTIMDRILAKEVSENNIPKMPPEGLILKKIHY